MNTKRILSSLVTGIMLTGSLALAAQGNDQPRAKSHSRARVAKPTTTMTSARANTGAVRTRNRVVTNTGSRVGVRTRSGVVTTSGDTVRVRSGNRVVTRSYPYRTYGYRSYSSGYPSYSYGPSFGFGYPYSSYGYGYPYDYYGGYPSNYNYGYYGYSQPGYTTYGNGSVVITVQSRLARAGYYHGPIDGVMGPATSYAIRAYERNHGLRVDGVISGQLMRNMGVRS